MSKTTQIFTNPPISLGNNNFLHIIEIESISPDLGNLINDKIRLITEGNTSTDLSLVKRRLYDYLQRKKGTTIEMGAVAEFMIHVYMNEAGFKQEFLFYNLEERSIKKGFDGYYSINNEEWILESKSGNNSIPGNTHPSKFSEAYTDLKNKVKDVNGNNPWRNAYNHACHIDVKSADDIRKNLKILTDDFDNKKYTKIENLNILPASTIFLEGTWNAINQSELESQIRSSLASKTFKGINILCINNKSIELLEDFLNL
ncbi:hypothetical protein [Aquimarina megaterium]|uniref:hypothetical protein n=1 Tax=Aquimarina megaterium TaxID=1443666 RepID=UPI00046F46D2|nr:hypothetical protein [Aquimarina megaterium]